jgi:hypothetical protein
MPGYSLQSEAPSRDLDYIARLRSQRTSWRVQPRQNVSELTQQARQ